MTDDLEPPIRRNLTAWVLLSVPLGLLLGVGVGFVMISHRADVVATERARASLTETTPKVVTPSPVPRGRPEAAPRTVPATVPRSAVEPAPPSPRHSAPPVEISAWTSLDAAMESSGENGKPVLIYFTADWCRHCRRLKRSVFDDSARGRAVQTAVIPVRVVDHEREWGSNLPEIESLQERFGVNRFPTLVVFAPATGRTVKDVGFGDPDGTVDWILQAAQAVR